MALNILLTLEVWEVKFDKEENNHYKLVKLLDCDIMISEFEVLFRTNTFWKIVSLITPTA